MFDNFFEIFYDIFIKGKAYKLMLDGLVYTLVIAVFAVLLGVILGALLAVCKVIPQKNIISKFFNGVANVYITVFRGTPVMVQLLLFYYGIFPRVMRGYEYKALIIAILVFGLNSAAYVAEIIRSGILSIDKGQMEAGRSLGFTYSQTMMKIILPQAIKNILPALGNEMITLLKDTSLVSVIALRDVTKQAQNIISKTYEPYIPYISLAIIYLVIVIILTKLLGILERRLRKSER